MDQQAQLQAKDEGTLRGWEALGFRPHVVNGPPSPTSSYLTGTVAVGVVIVTGLPWTAVQSTPSVALSCVAAAADGSATVWGVTTAGKAVRWNAAGKTWSEMSGASLLTEISVGSSGVVWGRHAPTNGVFRWNAGTGAFNRVAAPASGPVVSVSAGADGIVWAVTSAKQVVRWDGAAWQPDTGSLTQIAVGDQNTMWGLDGTDIYQWTSTTWTKVSGSLSKVSVASDGTVYGINTRGETVHFTRINPTVTNEYCLWQPVSSLAQISVGSKSNIWGIDSAGKVFNGDVRSGLDIPDAVAVRDQVTAGTQFLQGAEPVANLRFSFDPRIFSVDVMPGPDESQFNDFQKMEAPWRNAALEAMGLPGSLDGSRLYVERLKANLDTDWAMVVYITKYPLYAPGYSNQERSVIRHDVPPEGLTSLNRVFSHEFCHVFGTADEYTTCTCEERSGYFDIPNGNCIACTGTAQLPCLMNHTTPNFCDFTRGQLGWSIWEKRRNGVSWVSAAADGTVWALDASGTSMRKTGTGTWESKGGHLTQIAAGNATTVWGLNGTDVWKWTAAGGWAQTGAGKKSLSVGADGTVWSVDSQSLLPYLWDATVGGWRPMPQAPDGNGMSLISVGGATEVWALGSTGTIWRWNPPSGWWMVTPPSTGRISSLSVGSDGTAWGINATVPQRWNGNQWQATTGSLAQVSYGARQHLWATDSDRTLFQRRILATP